MQNITSETWSVTDVLWRDDITIWIVITDGYPENVLSDEQRNLIKEKLLTAIDDIPSRETAPRFSGRLSSGILCGPVYKRLAVAGDRRQQKNGLERNLGPLTPRTFPNPSGLSHGSPRQNRKL